MPQKLKPTDTTISVNDGKVVINHFAKDDSLVATMEMTPDKALDYAMRIIARVGYQLTDAIRDGKL